MMKPYERVIFNILKRLKNSYPWLIFKGKNFYFFFLLWQLFFTEKTSQNFSLSKKYYYLLIYFNLEKKLNLEYLNSKNNYLLILSEITKKKDSIFKISNKFFRRDNYLQIICPWEFFCRIDLFDFLVYGKYVNYLKKMTYNEYLSQSLMLKKYPLLRGLFLLIHNTRNEKTLDLFPFFKDECLFKRFHIYDSFSREKKFLIFGKSNSLKNLFSLLTQKPFVRFFFFLRKKKVYRYFFKHFYPLEKNILLALNYWVSVCYVSDKEDEDNVELDRLNVRGLYSLYWQTNRYDFPTDNYYYFFFLSTFFQKHLSIEDFNSYIFKESLFRKSSFLSFMWEKLLHLIVIGYFSFIFYKYVRFNRFKYIESKKKKFWKWVKFWKFLLKKNVIRFLPIEKKTYNSNHLLNEHIDANKNFVDSSILRIYMHNTLKKHNHNLIDLLKKYYLDQYLFNNLNIYQDIWLTFWKRYKRNLFANLMIQWLALDIFCKKMNTLFLPKENFYPLEGSIFWEKRIYIFTLKKFWALQYYIWYRKYYSQQYFIWRFEFMMLYDSYITLVNFYYVLLYMSQIYNEKYLKNLHIFVQKKNLRKRKKKLIRKNAI